MSLLTAKAYTQIQMKNIFVLLLLAVSTTFAADDEAGWSKPVNGLRARLIILSPVRSVSCFCRIFFEMQNISNIMGQKKIRFDLDHLYLKVTDERDNPLVFSLMEYSGFTPIWEPTLLPTDGDIKFLISFPGSSCNLTDKIRIDMGSERIWLIPQDGASYFLSGKLTIAPQKGDHSIMDWSGTLELPPVEITRPNREAAPYEINKGFSPL